MRYEDKKKALSILHAQELKHITRKTEQWRGPKGERRKVAVYDYVWEEECGLREVTTHVSIHTLHLDGTDRADAFLFPVDFN
jgi:hypothetical protein